MDITAILEPLNDAQRAAVTAPAAPILVVAGAGSGKTRVLVHRIAWLIQVENVSPLGILAVTFTNKAAAEMRGRIEQLLDMPVGNLWVGTFHGLAHRLLRRHWSEAGLPQGFQILDAEDQQRLIRRMLKNLEVDESTWAPREIQWFINAQKDEGLRPDKVQEQNDPHRRQLIHFYRLYEDICLVAFAGRRDRPALRGGRRRPIDLPLARRPGGEYRCLSTGFARHMHRQAGTELPLHGNHPESGQRGHHQ
jgi:DNA helicase-2/ATP-dependent DNA helicase PcrA